MLWVKRGSIAEALQNYIHEYAEECLQREYAQLKSNSDFEISYEQYRSEKFTCLDDAYYYGQERLTEENQKYKSITGKNHFKEWYALYEKDNSYSFKRFHKEVMLPTLRKNAEKRQART
ncbi:MAG: hypothetical protein FWH49_07755 [Clostridiales bacterium]|nr:hypothetical protein [Clostridiales bacterium]